MSIARLTLSAVTTTAVATWLAACIVTAGAAAPSAQEAPRPPQLLSETGLYAGDATGPVADGVLPYAPQYPPWSDGLGKRRWIALPDGATIGGDDPFAWDFPIGTKLWKEFALGDRRVETRFFWRASTAGWIAVSYVWNEAGTEAELAPAEGVRRVVEVAPGRWHDVPTRNDCRACHGPADRSRVLGVNALQLSADRDPGALHAEPQQPGMLTVDTLVADGRFGPTPPAWTAAPVRIAAREPETRAVLGYLAANCGMCHDGSPAIAGFDASLATRDAVADPDGTVARLVGTPTRWQAPGVPDGQSMLVMPGHAEASALYLRMRSRSPSTQMAPLGTVIRDAEAVAAIARWIDVTLALSPRRVAAAR